MTATMRKSGVEQARAELARIIEARDAAAAGLAAAEGRIDDAQRLVIDCDDLETDVALGELDGDAIAEDRVKANRVIEEASVDARRHRAALTGIDARIAEAERAVAESELAEISVRIGAVGEKKLAAVDDLAAKLRDAAAAVTALSQFRTQEAELLKRAAAAAEGLHVDAPTGVDEHEFRPDTWPALGSFLTQGPLTPNANREAARRAIELRDREAEERRIDDVARALADYGESEHSPARGRLLQLSEASQQAARERAQQIRDGRERFSAEQNARIRAENRETLGFDPFPWEEGDQP